MQLLIMSEANHDAQQIEFEAIASAFDSLCSSSSRKITKGSQRENKQNGRAFEIWWRKEYAA